MNLNGLPIPDGYTGIGLHDTPGASVAAWDYTTSRQHADALVNMGVTLYKLFVTGANKTERARAYVDAGIIPIVRPWIPEPWGRGLPVTPADQLQPYIDVGVRLVELGNEFNIACEWVGPIPGQNGIAREVVDWWGVCLRRASEVPGLIPLFPSNTPGGNVDHRLCYVAILAELRNRGLLDTVKHVAVHPRPHNNPPDTVWTATNTVTFDEWRWIRDQFRAFGVEAYFWATEHGHALGDHQNSNYPRIDLNLFTQYNRELQVRMDPAHPQAIEPEFAGHMHWYEAGWGHWGAWPTDALRDSPVPEMGAPSPLWQTMEQNCLHFSRYTEDSSPPDPPDPPVPPDKPARGIDVSTYQRVVNWDAAEEAGVTFAYIRQTAGLMLDDQCYRHLNDSEDTAILRGTYHYLMRLSGAKQARFAHSVYNDLGCELPIALDVEDPDLTGLVVRGWLERWCELSDVRPLVYTSHSAWRRLVGTGATWASDMADLWVANWDVQAPALPDPWDRWLFWQYGQRKLDGVYPAPVDVNWFNGTLAELMAWAGNGQPEPPEPETPWTLVVSYQDGLPLIVGDYPKAGLEISLGDPYRNIQVVLTGSKPEWGNGGFEFWATPEGETFMLRAEGCDYRVDTRPGQMAVVSWV